jgi:23S rRNA pseudouridine1911/1915/1917 synthase
VVWGSPDRNQGTVSARLNRSNVNRQKMAVSGSAMAREAITRFKVLNWFGVPPVASLVRCDLETGRTHQIRVHMAHIGHPLLGDQTYGAGFLASINKLPPAAKEALKSLNRQALHATLLGFEHPRSKAALHFESLPPPELAGLIEALEGVTPK